MQFFTTQGLLTIGAALEYYDFILYPMLAPYLLKAFFGDAEHPFLMYALFSMGYLLRPIGGLCFGYLGDRLGKKKALLSSMSIMGVSTCLIGLLPTYAQIGYLAPCLFLILRALQSLSFGGELPGTLTYLSETLEKEAFIGQVTRLFASLSFVNGICFLIQFSLTQISAHSFWRIAFLIGSAMAFISYYLRRSLEDQKPSEACKQSLWQLIKHLLTTELTSFLASFIMTFVTACVLITYLWYAHSPTLLNHFSKGTVLFTLALGNIISAPFFILGSSYFKKMAPMPLFLKCLLAYLILILFKPSSVYGLALYTACYQLLVVGFSITYACYLSLIYPKEMRYTAIGVTYNLAFVLGSFSPIILADLTPQHYLFVICMSSFAMIIVWLKNNAQLRPVISH